MRRRFVTRCLGLAGSAVLCLGLAGTAARADESVVAGLSQNSVSINANFNGSDILIYGAVKRDSPPPTESPLQVIVTAEGPSYPVKVRRKSHLFGIWLNTDSVTIDSAPSFYDIATTAPLDEILSRTEDLRHRISIPLAIRSVGAPQNIRDSGAFSDAVIRLRTASGDFRADEGKVRLTEETLFRTNIELPANLTEGNYTVRIFLTRDKQVIASYAQSIGVRKVGLERWFYRLAHQAPAAYGIIALALAAIAGWLASALFSYIRK